MKAWHAFAIAGAAFLVLLCAGVGLLASRVSRYASRETDSATRFADTLVPEVFRTWEETALERGFSPELKAKMPPERLRSYLAILHKRLRKFESAQPSFVRRTQFSKVANGSVSEVEIVSKASFYRDDAFILLGLIDRGAGWQIRKIRVEAKVLADSPPF